jgi:shikimate kinase
MAEPIRIALAGPPFSGKTTVGRLLGARLNLPFTDLDREVERVAGLGIPAVFRRRGEEGFRDLESRALRDVLESKELVLALGGGTLLDAENRRLVCGGMRVFTLWASAEELVDRSAAGGRPLAGTPGELRALLRRRRSHYLSLPELTDTTGLAPEQVAESLAQRV